MKTLKSGAFYFALVFGAGFVLGAIRDIWVVRAVGMQIAELLEAPVMLLVTILAARCVVRTRQGSPLGIGLVALGLMLLAEVGVAVGLWLLVGAKPRFTGRDPISGAVYLLLLALFAVMPMLASRVEAKK